MNIAYVKKDKLGKVQKIYRNFFKIIKKRNNCYYIPSTKDNILEKLAKKLEEDNVDYIIQEKDINCTYKELDGKHILRYMLPEVIEYSFKMLDKESKLEEIYICVEEFSRDNIKLIEEINERVKVVNIVTNHIKQFRELEKRLERNEIYITVSNNKRKSLKRAKVIINIDFENFKDYNINRNSIIINARNDLALGKGFEGICIEKVIVDTNKIMRIFSEMEEMNKYQLIEGEVVKTNEYIKAREVVKNNKLKIVRALGKRNLINIEEFKRLKSDIQEFEKIRKI